MSMNLYLEAERAVIVEKTGKKSTQLISFDLYQTPTKVTEAVLAIKNENRLSEYIKYVMSVTQEETIDVYDDNLMNDEPIGQKVIHEGKEHIASLRKFMQFAHEEGYSIRFYTI